MCVAFATILVKYLSNGGGMPRRNDPEDELDFDADEEEGLEDGGEEDEDGIGFPPDDDEEEKGDGKRHIADTWPWW